MVKPTLKKETVRIEVPTAKAAPQATVKLQQTQPMVRPPAAEVRTLATPTVSPSLRRDRHGRRRRGRPAGEVPLHRGFLFLLATVAVQVMAYLSK